MTSALTSVRLTEEQATALGLISSTLQTTTAEQIRIAISRHIEQTVSTDEFAAALESADQRREATLAKYRAQPSSE